MIRQLLLDTICCYEDVQETTLDCLFLSNVEFVNDFGPWKKDQKIDGLTFNFETGVAYSVDSKGQTIDTMKFTLTPFNDESQEND